MKSIIEASPKPDYHLSVAFDNGEQFLIDYKPFIKNGVSAALADEHFFKQLRLEEGFIYWPNGYDICPEALYEYAVQHGNRLIAA